MVQSRLRYISRIDTAGVGEFAGLTDSVAHDREILRARRKEVMPNHTISSVQNAATMKPDEVSVRGIAGAAPPNPDTRRTALNPNSDGEAEEKKPDNLIPESSGRLHDGRDHVLDELAGAWRCGCGLASHTLSS